MISKICKMCVVEVSVRIAAMFRMGFWPVSVLGSNASRVKTAGFTVTNVSVA